MSRSNTSDLGSMIDVEGVKFGMAAQFGPDITSALVRSWVRAGLPGDPVPARGRGTPRITPPARPPRSRPGSGERGSGGVRCRLEAERVAAALGLNADALVLLVTDTTAANNLYRVDIISTKPALLFAPPVDIGDGWSHRLLTFDGNDTLYGIAGNTMRRYRVGKAKPAAADITDNVQVGTGFS